MTKEARIKKSDSTDLSQISGTANSVSLFWSIRHYDFIRHSSFIGSLIEHPRMNIRSMHRRVAAGAPASSLTQQESMIGVPDIDLPSAAVLNLSVTLQAQVRIALDQQLAVNGTVGIMTDGAAFP